MIHKKGEGKGLHHESIKTIFASKGKYKIWNIDRMRASQTKIFLASHIGPKTHRMNHKKGEGKGFTQLTFDDPLLF